MLLAIDTSAGTSVAVVGTGTGAGAGAGARAGAGAGRRTNSDTTVRVERSINDTRRHAEVIGELVQECLAAAEVSVEDLSGVAVGMGPGPFTGLRVGVAAAVAFALGARLPLLRVVSHDAIAFEHYRAGGQGALLVTTDARRHERYWSAYRGAGHAFVPLRAAEPGLDRPERLAEHVTVIEGYTRLDADWVSAATVAALANALTAQGGPFASAEPLYLRSPDVTLASAPKRVS